MCSNVKVDFWNVGQGDASSIHWPDNSWDVIDVGPINSQLCSFFASHPTERIHALTLTHNDADHIGGLTTLVNIPSLRIDKVYLLKDMHDIKKSPLFRQLIKKVGAKNIYRLEREGEDKTIDVFDDYTLVVKYPNLVENTTASNSNDTSGILSLKWNDQDVIVWGGDNKIHTIKKHVSPNNMPMLFGPHHGGPSDCQLKRFSTDVGNMTPRQVVLSFETKNQYGHPCPQYLSALKKSKCQLICTQRCRKCKSEKYFPLVDGDGFYRMCPPLKGTACHGHVRVIVNGLEVHDELEAEYLANKQNVRNRKCL
jgi:beta-lactamase superfamily II metal-dependent hydrolase